MSLLTCLSGWPSIKTSISEKKSEKGAEKNRPKGPLPLQLHVPPFQIYNTQSFASHRIYLSPFDLWIDIVFCHFCKGWGGARGGGGVSLSVSVSLLFLHPLTIPSTFINPNEHCRLHGVPWPLYLRSGTRAK